MIQVIKTERQRRSILPVSFFLIGEMAISWQRNFRVFYLYRKNENRHTKIVSVFNLALRHDVCVV